MESWTGTAGRANGLRKENRSTAIPTANMSSVVSSQNPLQIIMSLKLRIRMNRRREKVMKPRPMAKGYWLSRTRATDFDNSSTKLVPNKMLAVTA